MRGKAVGSDVSLLLTASSNIIADNEIYATCKADIGKVESESGK